MKDYYAILGLDADASPESLKVAYRRLAREAHPDRVGHQGAEAQTQASARMAELNEAYSTLSDSAQRKEYDEEFKKWQARAAAGTPEPAAEPIPAPEPQSAGPAVQRAAARPAPQVISNVVEQFSSQIHSRLIQNNPVFAWRGVRMEGF
ncbi:MAG: DnaJ domain-containing protein, partial [Acidobacteria bacterium]|nr:DnaJ domain-containing protein [Acidobacteriota bacterium]